MAHTERLAQLSAHLHPQQRPSFLCATQAQTVTTTGCGRKRSLTDAQVMQFNTEGFLLLTVSALPYK